ncbi:MAG: hypothetical protein KDE14_01645 [Rhodobacteraceae bacterium]|nr:hypothetical protein [Paracoccaceae bacterium]
MTGALELNTPAAAVMMTIAEIAARDAVSRPAVSQQVKRLVEQHGLHVDRDERGRVAQVNVAQYDMLRERHGDPSKDQRPEREEEQEPARDSYDEALRQKTWYEAERKRLDLEEALKRLVPVDDVIAAVDALSETITSTVRTLQNETDILASALARGGPHELRIALKAIETKMLSAIATALDAIAEGNKVTE